MTKEEDADDRSFMRMIRVLAAKGFTIHSFYDHMKAIRRLPGESDAALAERLFIIGEEIVGPALRPPNTPPRLFSELPQSYRRRLIAMAAARPW
jgi:hypothetical protein